MAKAKIKDFLTVDGKLYYGWLMILCGFAVMFICYVVKANCSSLFYTPICDDFGIARTVYVQTNTFMTVTMLIGSLFIGKVFTKFPMKWVLSGSIALTCICFVGLSFSTEVWQLYFWNALQGFGWAGATNLPVTIMTNNWFGPKIKGTALSLAMLGSGAGALVWVNVVQSIITTSGWRMGFLAMAGINAVMIVIAVLVCVTQPKDKGYSHRVGDPLPEEIEGQDATASAELGGIKATQAIRTPRWWLQFFAHLLTLICASGFTTQCVAYYTDLTGDAGQAALIYSAALGTLILGKFLLGVIADVIKVKRVVIFAPVVFCFTFICLGLSTNNMAFSNGVIWTYMIGGSIASMIPALITARNFGDKEFPVLNGWMNMAGNIGQIIGPIAAALVFDITGTYQLAWYAFAVLMVVVGVLYGLSNIVSKKKIMDYGYTPAD